MQSIENFGEPSVGEKFPAAYNRRDGMTLALDRARAVNIFISMGEVTEKEARAFHEEGLRVGATALRHIPFMFLACPGLGAFEAPLNILAEPREKREAFLAGEAEAGLVTLYLIDNQTDILVGMRVLECPVDLMRTIKAAAFIQATAYSSADEVYGVIKAIVAEVWVEGLISPVQMQVIK